MLLSELAIVASYDVDGRRLVKPATTKAYKSAINSLARFLEKSDRVDVSLDELTPDDLKDWHDFLRSSGMTTRAANSYRRSIIATLRRIGYDELLIDIRQLKEPPRKNKAMKDKNLNKILFHANVRDAFMITLLRDSGARRGALPGLRHEDVLCWHSKDTGDWRLMAQTDQKGDTKVYAFGGHECAMLYRTWKSIQELVCGPTEFVITNDEGEPLQPDTITGIFYQLRARASLPRSEQVNPHALRHRFAHKMLDKYDAKVVSQWLGHANVTTTLDVYGERDLDELKDLYFGEEGRERV